VRIRRGTAAQNLQFGRAGIIHPVRRPGENTDRVARIDGKYLIAPHHPAFAGGDVINLLAAMMLVQMRPLPHRHDRFRQALVRIAVHRWVHQLADDRAVFGGEGFDTGVAALVHSVILTEPSMAK
jgi:hypothetical protein